MTSTGPPTPSVQVDRREIRRRRVQTVRRRTLAGSLAAFAAAWGIIFSQLVTGHDPALSNNKQATVAVSSSSTASGSAASPPNSYEPDYSTDDGYSSGSSNSSGSTGSSSSANTTPLTPMTTQQS
jgi:hypothetical protein